MKFANLLDQSKLKKAAQETAKQAQVRFTEALGQAQKQIEPKIMPLTKPIEERLAKFEKTAMTRISDLKAKVKIPSATERKRLRDAQVLKGLKKLGVATQDEMKTLQDSIDELKAQLAVAQEKKAKKKLEKEATPEG